ncbi:MAG: hypothetical protein Q4B96_06520 [Bacillota bacterium]|nr:hypothetical protein [Bacillota bacterium]
MLNDDSIIIILAFAFILIFIALQCFFALRRSPVPGLLMPLLFLVVWLNYGMDLGWLPEGLAVNGSAKLFYLNTGRIGFAISLILYGLCRLGMRYNAARRERQRQQRLQEKQLRQELAQRYFENGGYDIDPAGDSADQTGGSEQA